MSDLNMLASKIDGAELESSGIETALSVPREAWSTAADLLCSEGWVLSDLTAVDRGEAVEVVAWLIDHPATQLSLRTTCPNDSLQVDSLVATFPSAEWPEREVYDLFGVDFSGHPDMKRILLPDTFEQHPLRKSYELVEQTW